MRVAVIRGWCSAHYQRWRKYGDPLETHAQRAATSLCRLEDCTRRAEARGFCLSHYFRWKRYGDAAEGTRPLRSKDPAVRFWSLVNYAGPVLVPELGQCWLWQGSINSDGYGNFRWRGISAKAHRVSYELANGQIDGGLEVLHRCDNPPCVRDSHLFTGTQLDNMADAIAKNRFKGFKRGNRPWRTKLSEQHVAMIRERLAAGEHGAAIAREFQVGRSTIYHIAKRETWQQVQ